MATGNDDQAAPGSLEDFVATRKPKTGGASKEAEGKTAQRSREDAQKSHKDSSKATDDKKRKAPPSNAEHQAKHRKDEHAKSPEKKSSPKTVKHSHVSEMKHDSTKVIGAFVQTVEKVLTQFDGEKDRDAAFKKLQKDYLALLNIRQTEPEKLLEESNRIAKEAKAAHDDLQTKLRQQVANLTKKLDKYEKMRESLERAKAKINIDANDSEAVIALKNDNASLQAENDSLKKRLQKLESEQGKSSGSKTSSTAPSSTEIKRYEATVQDLSTKLAQSNKLLEVYELLTSLHINLTSTSDELVDVSCRAMDSLDAKQFCFDVKIPQNPRVELEYKPSKEEVDHHRRQTKPTVPEYLLDELTFQRSELTRFMRTILEAVIRKKS